MKSVLKVVLLVLLALTVSLSAQTSPFVQVSVGISSNLGYTGPLLSVGAGVESYSRLTLLVASGSYSKSAKLETGNGYSIGSTAFLYFRHKGFLFGPGCKLDQQRTAAWSKSNLGVPIGLGYEVENLRILASYYQPLHDRNQERVLGLSGEARLLTHVWLVVASSFISYKTTDITTSPRRQGVAVSVGVKYKF